MKRRNNVVKTVAVTAALLLGVGAGTLFAMGREPEGVFQQGIHIAGIDCGGRPVQIVRAELDGWRRARVDEPLVLSVGPATNLSKHWTPTRGALGADVDIDATIAAARSAAASQGLFSRISRWFSGPRRVDVQPHWTLDRKRATAYLVHSVAPSVRRAGHDARFVSTGPTFTVVPEQAGRALDIEGSLKAVTERLAGSLPEPVVLPAHLKAPHVTEADMRGITGEISHFSTHYAESGNRAKNIRVACRHINGTVLKPGDVFSYNKVVGPRDSESGFHMAPQIVNGKLEPGMGGGVCQVSSTLYNAALLADLKIVHREHHAFPVHYLPAGRDATVAYGDKDLQFKNNTDSVIAIAASGADGKVSMRIYGKPVPGREVGIERTNLSSWGPECQVIHDPDRLRGHQSTIDSGHAGHRVTVWRTVKLGGREVKREVLSHDYYDAFPRVISIGTRAAVRPVTAPNPGAGVVPSEAPTGSPTSPNPIAAPGPPEP